MRERIEPPFTRRGLVRELAARGLRVDDRTVWALVLRTGSSFKQRHGEEQSGPDASRRHARWTRYQGRIDPPRLVLFDETCPETNMAPLRGWAPKGERLIVRAPQSHGRTLTLIAALRHDRVDAPIVLDGLVPALRPGWRLWRRSAPAKGRRCAPPSGRQRRPFYFSRPPART